MFELGKIASDKITGFKGVITGRANYLYGCDTYCLTPEVNRDGGLQDSNWFDEGRIEIIGDGVEPSEVRVEKNGAGDSPQSSRSNPR